MEQENSTRMSVEMTEDEAAAFAAFKAAREKELAAEQRKADLKAYNELVDNSIEMAIPALEAVSQNLAETKARVFDCFKQALTIKGDLFKVKGTQRSHSFTNSAGDKRIILGSYVTDDYRDTVNEGIEMVKEYLSSLAKDDESATLVNAILRLLSKDQAGNLKASRVLQLRRMAEESGSESFMEGVRVIEQSYSPQESRQFIRVEVKDAAGKWKQVPLGMTEA